MSQYFREVGWNPWILTTRSIGSLPSPISEKYVFRPSDHGSIQYATDKNSLPIMKSPISSRFRNKYRFKTFDRYLYGWYKESLEMICRLSIDGFMPDLILASYGPASSLWIGRKLSKIFSVPWIADYRDLGALIDDDRNYFIKIIDRVTECILLKNCSLLTTVSRTLTEIMRQAYKKETHTIFNGWDANYRTKIKNDLSNTAKYPVPYLYYAGRFYEHRLKSFFFVLDAIKNYKNINLVIRSLGPANLESILIKYAGDLNLKDRVFVLEPEAHDVIHEESSHSLANIVLEDISTHTIHSKGTLTGKFFELLPLQPPILAVAREDSEMGSILSATNKGRLCSSQKEVTAFLNLLISDRDVFQPNNTTISQYSRKMQAEKLCGLMTSVIAQ